MFYLLPFVNNCQTFGDPPTKIMSNYLSPYKVAIFYTVLFYAKSRIR